MLDLRPEGEPPVPLTGPPGSGEPQPAVLLVSRAADRELDQAGRLLAAAGIPVTRLNAETAAGAVLAVDTDRRAVRLHDQWISPTVTWVRHFSARAMPDRRGAVRRIFAGQSWQALADQLGEVSGTALAARGPGSLEQLAAARRCQIAVPRTFVTADPASVLDRLSGGRVVIKAVHEHFVEAAPGLLTGVFPEIFDRAALAARSRAGGPPVLVQDYVDHDEEIRAYFARGRIAAFAVAKDYPAQLWLHPEEVTARDVEPSPAITAAVSALAAELALEYGAFDFLISGGMPVFLEVNVSGDWCWLESLTGTAPVTAAVSSMLAELHDEALARNGRPARRNSLDPVRFLTGGLAPHPG